MTKVLIVSGFLGAGKTTFIRELVKRTSGDVAVLENEYASVNVDQDILKSQLDIDVYEMTERCICCTGKSDFASSVLTIVNTLEPEILVVEPTGVGYLSKVTDILSQIEYERIALLSPVTIIDPNSFDSYRAAYADLFEDQICCAGKILLSRVDENIPSEVVRDVKSKICAIKPKAEVIQSHYSQQPDSFWQGLLYTRLDGSIELIEDKSDEITFESATIKKAEIRSVGDLVFFMERIIRGQYGRIIRGKGVVSAGRNLLRVDLSDRKYIITPMETGNIRDCVFIGEEIDRAALNNALMPKTIDSVWNVDIAKSTTQAKARGNKIYIPSARPR